MELLYSKMKIFHFKDKLDSLPVKKNLVLPPLHIRIKPTNVCSHNCWYCGYRRENIQLGKDMVKKDYIPREKMMEIIDDILDMGVRAVTFSGGGDPFDYSFLLEGIKKLSRSPIKFASLTNGTKLKGEIAEIFAHYGTWLRISIDGWDDESYSQYRRVPKGEFTKVMKNMEDFKEMEGRCLLGIYVIIDNKNASHIYGLIKRLKDIGVDSVKLAPCLVSDSGKENNKYHAQIFNLVKEQVQKAIEEFAGEGFEIFDSYHEQLETFKKDYKWCPYIQINPVIGADLNVYSCHDKAYNLEEGLIGSIKKQSFKDFWFLDKNNFFRIDPTIHCNHHCVVNEKNKLILDYLNADEGHLEFV
ncbi:MAG TPA: radical SAM/SPASM domain-containing protein [Candidatus Brocadiaceae bacterium]